MIKGFLGNIEIKIKSSDHSLENAPFVFIAYTDNLNKDTIFLGTNFVDMVWKDNKTVGEIAYEDVFALSKCLYWFPIERFFKGI